LDWNRTKDIFINNVPLEQDTIGIHWYAGDLIAQQFNERITLDNVAYGNSTLSNTIMKHLDIKRKPKSVSVLIPSFKRSEQLRWNLFSLANQQTEFDFEVIVLNDGFNDDETEHVCRLYNKRLQLRYLFTGQRSNGTLVRKLKHQGAKEALDAGLNQAVGETIVISGAEMFLPQRDTLDKLIKAAKADPNVVATTHVVDDLDGSLLKELNDNFGALGDFKKDKQMVVFRDVSDVFDKPYLIAYQKDLDRSKAHMAQVEAEAIHLYHGQSNAKRSYHVIEAPQATD
jgi:glycosyltransferase involved in cell wall biosynthesis